jgi:chromosome segregation ATPase
MLRWAQLLNANARDGLAQIRQELLAGLPAGRAARALYRALTAIFDTPEAAARVARVMREDLERPPETLAQDHPEAMSLALETQRILEARRSASPQQQAARERLEMLTRRHSEAQARLRTLEENIGAAEQQLAGLRGGGP